MTKINIGLRAAFAALLTFASIGLCAQLTAERDTPARAGNQFSIGAETGATIYAGSLVAVNANGWATNALNVSGYIVVGRAAETIVNTVAAGFGSTGALQVAVDTGTFGWRNAGDVTRANIGAMAYIVDDQTVSVATNGNNVIAGIVVDVDGSYVWVDTFNVPRTAGSFTTLSASGVSTLSGDTTAGDLIAGQLNVSTNAFIVGTLSVTGDVTMSDATIGALTIATNLVNGAGGTNGPVLRGFTTGTPGTNTLLNAPTSTNTFRYLQFTYSNSVIVIPYLPLNGGL